jgi:RNA polymerase sigma-70 factor (ECF subfamily)
MGTEFSLAHAGPESRFAESAVETPDSKLHEQRLEQLVAEQLDFVWRSLRRLGVPVASVDDATQQVWLIAAKKLPEIAAGSERAFLFGTAVRIASEVRRKLARKREVSGALALEVEDPTPGAEELMRRRQARSVLDLILEALPEDLRVVFILYELEEQTAVEIAELLSVPPGTVASRLRRARSAFEVAVKRLKAGHAKQGGL